MPTTSIAFDWISSQISTGPERNQFADSVGEENPETLPNRVTLPGSHTEVDFCFFDNEDAQQLEGLGRHRAWM
jgi:hypothetical protein